MDRILSHLPQHMVDIKSTGKSVFTSLDLHTNKLVTDEEVKIINVREEMKAALRPLRKLVKARIEEEFGVENILPTSPLLISLIRVGLGVHDYTRPHVDMDSYEETLIHFTSILYLNNQSLRGGEREK